MSVNVKRELEFSKLYSLIQSEVGNSTMELVDELLEIHELIVEEL